MGGVEFHGRLDDIVCLLSSVERCKLRLLLVVLKEGGVYGGDQMC